MPRLRSTNGFPAMLERFVAVDFPQYLHISRCGRYIAVCNGSTGFDAALKRLCAANTASRGSHRYIRSKRCLSSFDSFARQLRMYGFRRIGPRALVDEIVHEIVREIVHEMACAGGMADVSSDGWQVFQHRTLSCFPQDFSALARSGRSARACVDRTASRSSDTDNSCSVGSASGASSPGNSSDSGSVSSSDNPDNPDNPGSPSNSDHAGRHSVAILPAATEPSFREQMDEVRRLDREIASGVEELEGILRAWSSYCSATPPTPR